MKHSLLIFTFIALCSLPLYGQAIEDPGPYPAGWQDVSFVDLVYGQGTISGRMFYPAVSSGQGASPDPSAGPYPLVAFQHGWLASPSSYDNLCTHMASWGFLVASTGTETGFLPDHEQFARDTRSFLHWVDLEATDPQSWLFGMAWNGDWAASGHSMGGGVLALLIGIEPRVRTIIGLQSASMGGPAVQNMQSYTGRAFQVAGSVDWLVPPGMVHAWFDQALSAARNVYFLVEGMGHTGCMDDPVGNEPLPGPEQARLHRRLVTGLLRAEVKKDENLYADLLGEGMDTEPVIREVDCEDPPFWARESVLEPGKLLTGLGAIPATHGFMMVSLDSASIPTSYGTLGLDPMSLIILYSAPVPAGGWCESRLFIPQSASGITVFLQGAWIEKANSGRLTRTVEFVVP